MRALTVAKRLLVALLALVMLMASATMAWAVATDFSDSDTIPEGVRVVMPRGEFLAVGGMTRAEATRAITEEILGPVLSPVSVRYKSKTFVLDPQSEALVSVNADSMIGEAFRVRQQTAFISRVVRNVTGETDQVDIAPRYSVDASKTLAWVARAARQIDRRAVDSTRTVVGNELVVTTSTVGASVRQASAVRLISDATLDTQAGAREVRLPVTLLKPKVTEDSLGRAIIVDKSDRDLTLYDGAKIIKHYRVAVGMPGFPTPLGDFHIVEKRYRPTWRNPGSGWAKDMPAFIPPGPGNPLGTRALNLNAPGIRIHGTNKIGSIGTAASHGCVRMIIRDVEELYDLVDVGTPVYIVP